MPLLLGGLLLGCVQGRPTLLPPPSAEALSLLGDTLWTVPLPPGEGPIRVARLQVARDELSRRPFSLNATMVAAHRNADLGRLREAIRLYGQARGLDLFDPRPSRRRGELYLRVREFDLAMADLEHASRHLPSNQLPEVENLPGGGVAISSLQFSTAYYLGMAHYLKGDWLSARGAYRTALGVANNADDLAAALLWYFYAARRLESSREVSGILDAVNDEYAVVTRQAELRLLLSFKGVYPPDSLRLLVADSSVVQGDANYAYGVGFALLMQGRTLEAEQAFGLALRSTDWTTMPYIAAEVELARMRRTPDATEP